MLYHRLRLRFGLHWRSQRLDPAMVLVGAIVILLVVAANSFVRSIG